LKRFSVALFLCLLASLGCEGGATPARVKGKVTVDGAPLGEGSIRLIPLDGKAPTSGSPIEDGEYYVANAPATGVRVEITAPKVVGKRKAYDTPESPFIDVTREILPDKYHVKSELKRELTKGENELNFDLRTK
jgi:hypothetical protein